MSDPNEIDLLIDETGGRWFSVTFIKKDGTERRMNARTAVTKHLQGGELKFNPRDHGLRVVFDAQKKKYRMVNLQTVTHFKCGQIERRFLPQLV